MGERKEDQFTKKLFAPHPLAVSEAFVESVMSRLASSPTPVWAPWARWVLPVASVACAAFLYWTPTVEPAGVTETLLLADNVEGSSLEGMMMDEDVPSDELPGFNMEDV